MPFGTELLPDGTRFRIWAPAARAVDLCLPDLNGTPSFYPMTAHPNGWHRIFLSGISAGRQYQFRIDRDLLVPDPASRFQPNDIHGTSEVVDPDAFRWQEPNWQGRPWEEAVIYELHVGAFSDQGTYAGVLNRLDYLTDLGITAIELMPLAHFPGSRNWGYDGALLFAPDSTYGRPEDLKNLVHAAHKKGLMVFLDVVYNHFGPEGNYLYLYAKEEFFTNRFHTPWGDAINYAGVDSRTVRDFFIANALYWLEEYHFDGLRLDAVHAIFDDSHQDILQEISLAVHQRVGTRKQVHLVLENDHNQARYLSRRQDGRPKYYTAQWNDDIHHACHVLLTGETAGYYADYVDDPIRHLGRCLTEGFSFQGEKSSYRNDLPRGEQSSHLPPTAFISFLQNHDQVGNRAFGERITVLTDQQSLRIAASLILLAPAPPLLFMGEEFGAEDPFYFFCDFGGELAERVFQGRKEEFRRFPEFNTAESRAKIPDPNDASTFFRSKIKWQQSEKRENKSFFKLYRQLLALRRQYIVPRLRGIDGGKAGYRIIASRALEAWWIMGDGSHLTVVLCLQDKEIRGIPPGPGVPFFAFPEEKTAATRNGMLPGRFIAWYLDQKERKNV